MQDAWVVGLDGEGMQHRVVGDHVHRPDGHVLAGHQSVEVDEGHLALHGTSETNIVWMVRDRCLYIGTPAPRRPFVLVGNLPPLYWWDGKDAERHLREDRRLEDPLRSDNGNPPPFVVEPGGQKRSRQHLTAVEPDLIGEPGECGGPDGHISVHPSHGRDGRPCDHLPSRGVHRRRSGAAPCSRRKWAQRSRRMPAVLGTCIAESPDLGSRVATALWHCSTTAVGKAPP